MGLSQRFQLLDRPILSAGLNWRILSVYSRPKARPVVGRVRVTGFPSLAKAMEQRYFTHLGLRMGPTFRPVRSSVLGLIFV
jgi:hypothetical protein